MGTIKCESGHYWPLAADNHSALDLTLSFFSSSALPLLAGNDKAMEQLKPEQLVLNLGILQDTDFHAKDVRQNETKILQLRYFIKHFLYMGINPLR